MIVLSVTMITLLVLVVHFEEKKLLLQQQTSIGMLKVLQTIKKTSIGVRVLKSGLKKGKEFCCFRQPWNWQLEIHSLTKQKITYQVWMGINWPRYGTSHRFYLFYFWHVVNSTITKTFLGLHYLLVKVYPWNWLIYIVF